MEGRVLTDRALVSDQAPSGLAASRFDPSRVQLMLGDCLERMAEIPAASVDAVICDPPYGTTACKWDAVIPLRDMWAELERVTKPSAAIVLTCSQPFTSALGASKIDWLRYSWTWRKSRPSGHLNAKRMPLKDTEDALVFYREQPTYNPQGVSECAIVKRNTPGRLKAEVFGSVVDRDHVQTVTGYPRQVLDFASVHNVGAHHPTEKPVALMKYFALTYTHPGDTILDFTMGSGTTGVAAVKTGRSFIGIERDPTYFEIAQSRVSDRSPQGQDAKQLDP